MPVAMFNARTDTPWSRSAAEVGADLATDLALGLTHAQALQRLQEDGPNALAQPLPVYGYGAAMALFSTVLPVFMNSAAIRRIGSAKAVLIGTLGPVLTIFFGWWLLDEALSLAQLAGAGLVLAGVLLTTQRTKVAPAAA